ncbi:MAG: hypothetical protein ACRDD1_20480 [Planctomycetia bacterium]
MSTDAKPLFRPEAVRPKLKAYALPEAALEARPKLATWAELLASKEVERRKETELLPNFLRDVFEDLLGYVGPPAADYTLRREALVKVDGKFADAALGRFSAKDAAFVAAVEGKGPRDPLDVPFSGRKQSAVQQALQYAVQLKIDWYLVTNLRETRLYHKANDTFTYERFAIEDLANADAELKRFHFLLLRRHGCK